jgi:putative FmdB family regulatory protein
MPTYSYKCGNCDEIRFEIRNMSDSELEILCRECSEPMKRVFDFGSVAFKGSGFYSTDK